MDIKTLIQRAESTHRLSEEEILYLLQAQDADESLLPAADRVRRKYVGDEIHLRALIEFSNICKNNCLYCGLRAENTCINRYRMDEETIFSFAQKAVQYGYKTIVLQGGEDPAFTTEVWLRLLKRIKTLGLAITLSIGERPFEDYRAFKAAGADRYLLRIETTDKSLYEKYNPSMSFENRLRCLHDLKKLGYEVGTGVLVGLPGQTLRSLAKDILFFQELGADMIGLGPFIPNPQTPLKNAPTPVLGPALRVMALTRLLLPDVNIPATTAMETLQPNGRILALQSGANVVMPNLSPAAVRKKYALYDNKISAGEEAAESVALLKTSMASIGYQVVTDRGDWAEL